MNSTTPLHLFISMSCWPFQKGLLSTLASSYYEFTDRVPEWCVVVLILDGANTILGKELLVI